MTWDAETIQAGIIGLASGGLGGLTVRPLIGQLPEPEPEPEPEQEPDSDDVAAEVPEPAEPPPPKILYADLADAPGLTIRAVLAGAVVGAVLGLALGREWTLLLALPLIGVGIALAVIDARTRLLPTRLVLPATGVAIVLGTVVAIAQDDRHALVRAFIGLVVVRSIFWVLWWFRSSGMGFGDVRLAALLGFVLGYLGWSEVVIGVYAAFLEFTVPGLVLAAVLRDKSRLKARVPFGPFLLVGAVTGIAFGPWVASSLGY
ncbi:prepilin peptidase [Nocardioides marmorisolisilvae]|uniref:Prepilin peptidase n=1 Tax=Nocardioides marmorisolisilvae TaxID=1542737 RepID=A0A3N0DUQ4_9ACTN|nr:A24 family peptidase [Nocardioides marmorisolisilvae]RNL79216.1 prepilin peptidase [Nocardioides marmorisolisilvae]